MLKIDLIQEAYHRINYVTLKEAIEPNIENVDLVKYSRSLCINIVHLPTIKAEIAPMLFDFTACLTKDIKYTNPNIVEDMLTKDDIIVAMKKLGVKDSAYIIKHYNDSDKISYDTIFDSYLQSQEEAALISLYTYEDEKNGTSPYRIINKKLWDEDIQDQLKDKKSFLKLLLCSLRKLPRTEPQTLYRGIKKDKHKYFIGEEIVWKGLSSTSTSMRTTQSFLANSARGTLFEIRNAWGYDIQDFSLFSNEEGYKKNS